MQRIFFICSMRNIWYHDIRFRIFSVHTNDCANWVNGSIYSQFCIIMEHCEHWRIDDWLRTNLRIIKKNAWMIRSESSHLENNCSSSVFSILRERNRKNFKIRDYIVHIDCVLYTMLGIIENIIFVMYLVIVISQLLQSRYIRWLYYFYIWIDRV